MKADVPSLLHLLLHHVEEEATGCWRLTTGRLNRNGYRRLWVEGQEVMAHKAFYNWFVGPVPHGCVLDHVKERGCCLRECVRPDHLEPVTVQENTKRGAAVLFTRQDTGSYSR